MKHHCGKGDQFCINEDSGLQEARRAGPYRGNKGKSLKDYFTDE